MQLILHRPCKTTIYLKYFRIKIRSQRNAIKGDVDFLHNQEICTHHRNPPDKASRVTFLYSLFGIKRLSFSNYCVQDIENG